MMARRQFLATAKEQQRRRQGEVGISEESEWQQQWRRQQLGNPDRSLGAARQTTPANVQEHLLLERAGCPGRSHRSQQQQRGQGQLGGPGRPLGAAGQATATTEHQYLPLEHASDPWRSQRSHQPQWMAGQLDRASSLGAARQTTAAATEQQVRLQQRQWSQEELGNPARSPAAERQAEATVTEQQHHLHVGGQRSQQRRQEQFVDPDIFPDVAEQARAPVMEQQHLQLERTRGSGESQMMCEAQSRNMSQGHGLTPFSPRRLAKRQQLACNFFSPDTTELSVIEGDNNVVINNYGTLYIEKPPIGATAAVTEGRRANLPPQIEGARRRDDPSSHGNAETMSGVQIEELLSSDDDISFQEENTAQPAAVVPNGPSEKSPKLFADQRELAENAVTGKNTVLVAPTGSGKTHVAAYTIHNHFISNRSKPVEERRALFLVTTVNLVEQQRNKLKSLLEHEDDNFFSVVGIHGASELSLRAEVGKRNVIVLTAQLLENALNDIPLDYFSLIVFDECHLCQKEHAYNTIMARYLAEKHRGNTNLPQIVGMTASLGTGKAKEQADANSHAVQICANMDAHSISMVVRNIAVLKKRINIPKEVKPIEVCCRKHDPFADKLNEIMGEIETMLKESPFTVLRMHVNSDTVPCERGSQAYRQWCDRLKRSAQKFINYYDGIPYRILQTCVSQLMDYNTALLINKQVRTKDAFNHLDQMMDAMNDRRSTFDDNDRKLWMLFNNEERTLERIKDDPGNENPLLEKLCQIILEEYRIRPHSRAILFVKTIDTTQALQDWIKDMPELAFLNPGRIAGSRDMNSNKQNQVIKQFRNGDHKMLVATNLLEQGTDVPACNLVIRLDYVPSDFGHVQIKGRTRAKDGRSYLITLVDSKGAARDSANRQREIMMIVAAQYLKDMPERRFLFMMKNQQESDRSERQIREEKKRNVLHGNRDEVFTFCCGMCGVTAFQSPDIGLYREYLYLVLDPGFTQRLTIRPHPKPQELGKDVTIIAKMFCKRCGHDWGSLACVKQSFYPSAKIVRFSLKIEESDVAKTFKKWKDAPFKVRKLDTLPPEAKVIVPREILRKLEV